MALSQQVLQAVQSATAREYPENAEVFHEGDIPDNAMYFVFRGEIGIYKHREEGEREINRIGPGKFFGEMALINERPRLATARVTSSGGARVGVMTRATLLRLAGSSPQFLFFMLRYAIERLLAAEDKLQKVREDTQEEMQRRGMF